MEKPTIFFDMDGVLVESNDRHYDATVLALADFGIALPPNARELNGQGKTLKDILRHIHVPEPIIALIRKKRDEYYRKLLRDGVRWTPGAIETLRALRKRQPIAVITNSEWEDVLVIHEMIGIRHHVDLIIAPSKYKVKPKPKPYGILLAKKRLNIKKTGLFVGDQPFDIHAAHAAEELACLYDPHHRFDSAESDADIIIHELPELIHLLAI